MRSLKGIAIPILIVASLTCHSFATDSNSLALSGGQPTIPNSPSNETYRTLSVGTENKKGGKEGMLQKDLPVWVSNVIALFAGLVSLINLFVVIYFFIVTNK